MVAGRLRARAGKRALFHPQDLTRSVLSAWWCADDHGTSRMTDDGSGLISNWVDRVGGLAVTATTTARPTWTSNAFNSSFAGLTFDGVANVLAQTVFPPLPTSSTEGWIWVVGNAVVDSSIIASFFSYGGASSGTFRTIAKSTSASGKKPEVHNGTDVELGDASMSTAPHILGGNFAAVTQNGYLDGVPFSANPATTGALATGTTNLRLGRAQNSSAFGNVILRHSMVLTGPLSTANRQKLEGWLAWDSGLQASLPATHPYGIFRP